ncbi:aminoglycoside 6'-N-acetyltransferase [Xanthomonas floridensis]|uniref:Aminoglycoside N(6')-acetyltransferase type 1 n=1 Tax=Xanthomonas floridensis TaxID=1843580 RepID=A0A1A9MH66_9XANT|nr:aminoglycoside 6'-N-acetyltransferase [Xanthomonas floridensis]MEA5123502.1 aminoglycoside 6'-N-acetyltransferase [Xanthomonas floridensis]MEA5130368.1 aminoglycoside 6'-N-acetyltransferase [Xanthomonas floridensis]OAG69391.1 aminoglycoside 6'-acetyltransferase [Xanthomonas floridensis]
MNAQAGWRVRAAVAADAHALLALRLALWPDADDGLDDLQAALAQSAASHLVVVDDADAPLGFAEVSVRHDHVNGTDSTPVGFLEGWYVVPAWRGRGLGRALVAAAAEWTRDQGCAALASDARLEDSNAQAAHAACGFEPTERVVYFRLQLA